MRVQLPYKVKTDKQFDQQLQEALGREPRFQKAYKGLCDALTQNPEEFPIEFVEYRIRSACIGNWPGISPADIFFTVHGDEVRLHWMIFPILDTDDGFEDDA